MYPLKSKLNKSEQSFTLKAFNDSEIDQTPNQDQFTEQRYK